MKQTTVVKGHNQHQPNEPATWLQQLITTLVDIIAYTPRSFICPLHFGKITIKWELWLYKFNYDYSLKTQPLSFYNGIHANSP